MDEYIDQTLYNGDSFLHLAAQQQSNDIRKQTKTMKLRIAGGASINVKNVNGNTPLHLVKNVRTAKTLYKEGASLKMKNSMNQTPAEHFKHNIKERYQKEDHCLLNEWFRLKEEKEQEKEKENGKIKEIEEGEIEDIDTSGSIDVDSDSDSTSADFATNKRVKQQHP